jgi:hypothetical protein
MCLKRNGNRKIWTKERKKAEKNFILWVYSCFFYKGIMFNEGNN